jgi:ubiquinone biosynthesis monooxygenase Coq7
MNQRKLNSADNFIIGLDKALRTMFATPIARRPNPADANGATDDELSPEDARRSGALMRVNHAGEVCAQALYQGQGLTARNPRVREAMQEASDEENDHLAWCEARLEELDDHKSRLTALWFCGSFAIGGLAGACGDRWSLGFLGETERQVVRHLDGHLKRLPAGDERSRRIIQQMKTDEGKHAHQATGAGGRELPGFISRLMARTSRIMTFTAERI